MLQSNSHEFAMKCEIWNRCICHTDLFCPCFFFSFLLDACRNVEQKCSNSEINSATHVNAINTFNAAKWLSPLNQTFQNNVNPNQCYKNRRNADWIMIQYFFFPFSSFSIWIFVFFSFCCCPYTHTIYISINFYAKNVETAALLTMDVCFHAESHKSTAIDHPEYVYIYKCSDGKE